MLALVRCKGVGGLPARDAAMALCDTPEPTKAQKETARRKLIKLEGDGVLVRVERDGASTWFLAERRGTGRYEK